MNEEKNIESILATSLQKCYLQLLVEYIIFTKFTENTKNCILG